MGVGVLGFGCGFGCVGLVMGACLADLATESRSTSVGLTEIVKQIRTTGRLLFTTFLQETVDKSLLFTVIGTPALKTARLTCPPCIMCWKASLSPESMDGHRIIIITKSTVPMQTHKKVILFKL